MEISREREREREGGALRWVGVRGFEVRVGIVVVVVV